MLPVEPAVFEEQTIEIVPQKVYKPQMIRIATFLGGPIVAGYLIAENYKAFGETHRVTPTWVITIVVTAVIFGVAFFAPFPAGSPRIVIPLIYSLATFYLVNMLQGDKLTAHAQAGGEVYGWGRAILISLIGCVVTLAVGVVFVLATNPS